MRIVSRVTCARTSEAASLHFSQSLDGFVESGKQKPRYRKFAQVRHLLFQRRPPALNPPHERLQTVSGQMASCYPVTRQPGLAQSSLHCEPVFCKTATGDTQLHAMAAGRGDITGTRSRAGQAMATVATRSGRLGTSQA